MITGGAGQVGQIIYPELCDRYGKENVLVTDLKETNVFKKFEKLDALDAKAVNSLMENFSPDIVIHLPSLLSAMGEKHPELMEVIGIGSFKIVSQECIKRKSTLFVPSSIAVYGTTSIHDETPEKTACEPLTIYGCTKIYLELLGSYYRKKFDLDFRS